MKQCAITNLPLIIFSDWKQANSNYAYYDNGYASI